MITASIVLYKTNRKDVETILLCSLESCIEKIYIVDNSPTPDLKAFIENLSSGNKKVEYIYGQGNIGFGRGNNIAIQKAITVGSTYHLVLNPDIIFEPSVIAELVEYMGKCNDVGQLLPKVTYPDGSLQYLCRLLPTPFDMFGRRLLPSSWMKKRNARYEMHFSGYNETFNAPTLSGCFMLLKTSILKRVGLFDEQFFMYFEDNDLTRRIHQVSKTVYYPKVTIIHNHASEHRHNKFLLKESIKSAIKYFNKWGWFFDKERRMVNDETIKSFKY